jgi:TonB family protein
VSAPTVSAAGGTLGGIIGSVPTVAGPAASTPTTVRALSAGSPVGFTPRTIKSITVVGLPEQERNELLAKLPFHEGDPFIPESVLKLSQSVRDFDEHLSIRYSGTDDLSIQIMAPGAFPAPQPMQIPAGTVTVSGSDQADKVVRKVVPMYPDLAKRARVAGVVHLEAIIGKDGTVLELHAAGGPALLIQAALDAVKQWVYKPTLMNGNAVPVATTIDVNFTLDQ